MKKQILVFISCALSHGMLPMQPTQKPYDHHFDGISIPDFKAFDAAHQTINHLNAIPLHKKQFGNVLNAYRSKGWNIPKSVNLKFDQYFGTIGTMESNGVDTITIRGNLQKWFTPQETEFVISHELAHIALRNHKWLNPHWYFDLCVNPLTIGIITGLTCIKIAKCIPSKQNLQAFFTTLMGSGYLTCTYVIYRKCSWFYDKNTGIYHSRYAFLNKLEEFECDVIGALVLPEGGKHGASFFQKSIDREGGNNENDTDHPKLTHRLKYLKAIQWFQEHGVKKHT